jgi:tetratricopeptide (TPR) repeat protein
MSERLERDWLLGRATLGVAAGWKAEEMRVVADLGYALAEQGRNEEAAVIFEGLATLTPATAYFRAALGALWLRMDEPRRAIRHLDVALRADPRDALSLLNRGEAYLRLNDRVAARADLSAAVEAAATSPAAEGMKASAARAGALLAHLDRAV